MVRQKSHKRLGKKTKKYSSRVMNSFSWKWLKNPAQEYNLMSMVKSQL